MITRRHLDLGVTTSSLHYWTLEWACRHDETQVSAPVLQPEARRIGFEQVLANNDWASGPRKRDHRMEAPRVHEVVSPGSMRSFAMPILDTVSNLIWLSLSRSLPGLSTSAFVVSAAVLLVGSTAKEMASSA